MKLLAVLNTSLSFVGKSSVVRTGRSPGFGIMIINGLPNLNMAKISGIIVEDFSVTVAGPRRHCTELPF
jgi:hypothetical protein